MTLEWLDPIETALSQERVVLTPSASFANTLNSAWYEHQGGGAVQKAPRIFSVAAWLEQCWLDLLASSSDKEWHARVLSAHEERVLWARVISADQRYDASRSYLLAKEMQQAEQLVQEYQLDMTTDPARESFSEHEASDSLRKWREQLYVQLRKSSWVTMTERVALISQAFQKGALKRLSGITAVEFLHTTPLYAELLQNAAQKVDFISLDEPQQNSVQGHAFLETQDELSAAVLWARNLIHKKPDARIGIAVHDLPQILNRVERICCEILAPISVLSTHAFAKAPFYIQSPRNLIEAPAIRDAMRLLQLISADISRAQLQALLRSPFLWQKLNLAKNLKLRNALQDWHAPQVSLADFMAWARQHELTDLVGMLSSVPVPTDAHSVPEWCQYFDKVLLECGWMTTRASTHAEQQQCHRWNQAIEQFAGGADIYGLMSAPQAYRALQDMLQDTRYQDGNQDAPIKVLNASAAVDERFDYLWVSGLSAEEWPKVQHANPIIPLSVQKQHKMLDADFDAHMAHYQKISERLLGAAPDINLSYSKHAENKQSSGFSNMFGNVSVQEYADSEIASPYQTWHKDIKRAAKDAVTVQDNGHVPVSEERETHLGVADIANQSACPFKSFAKKRLRAGLAPFFRSPYPENTEIGSLVHDCLEKIWSAIGDSEQLNKLPKDALRARIEQTTRACVDKRSAEWKVADKTRGRIWDIQYRKIVGLLVHWFEVEKTVLGTSGNYQPKWLEEKTSFAIDQAHLNVRIDRVDLLGAQPQTPSEHEERNDEASLSVRILDYKTGSGELRAIQATQEPIRQPQLLIYALALLNQKQIKRFTLGWAMVNHKFLGDSGGNQAFTYVIEDALATEPDATNIWHNSIQTLVREYLAGTALVKPQFQDACKHCEYRPICRIEKTR